MSEDELVTRLTALETAILSMSTMIEIKWLREQENEALKEENLLYFNLLDSRENEILRLKKQLKKANVIINHVCHSSQDSQSLAWEYLEANKELEK